MITATELTPTRHMTLSNGASARVDFEGSRGKLHAVFEDKVVGSVKRGDPVHVDGVELTVTSTGPARQGHTSVVAQPETFHPVIALA